LKLSRLSAELTQEINLCIATITEVIMKTTFLLKHLTVALEKTVTPNRAPLQPFSVVLPSVSTPP